MDIPPARDSVNRKHLQVERISDSPELDFTEILSLAQDSGDSSSSECVSGDLSAEVHEENLAFVQQELDDVCCVINGCVINAVHLITAGGAIGSEGEGGTSKRKTWWDAVLEDMNMKSFDLF